MQKVAIRLINKLDVDSSIILLSRGLLDEDVTGHRRYFALPAEGSRVRRLTGYWPLARDIAAYIDQDDKHVLMLFGHSMVVLGFLVAIFSRSHVALVANIRNSFAELAGKRRPRPDVVHMLASYALRRCRRVVAVSQALAGEVRQMGVRPDRVRVIPNGVDLGELLAMAGQQLNHPWLQDDAAILVAVGRLSPQKNQQLLLRAMRQVKEQRPIRLWVIGDGPDRAQLEELTDKLGLAGDVEFLGYIPNPHQYIARADCFVLSSKFEGFPNALLEAMALGKAVIATDCPTGPAELIRSGENGLLVPTQHEDALAAAILRVLDDPKQARCMGVAAARTAGSYDVETMLSKFEAMIDELVAR
jgi:glycosyltransferase involved in cell wall biosynthesis